MEMNRFDIYRELWTKSRTAFAEEQNIEFNDLKGWEYNGEICID
ncbi:hypothetical protein [Mammaliicoccus stepanovicii]|uniref:Uncharacterized protein n=1 Tax=Mammaliicoccus stepanovicii TaxID=643214 RepID=A0A0K2JNY3_9STAP|nr:hypothetical protein [Mammaliicoccus stepanovicii]ALB00608.1 hypothetical protein [Mammaliicoccus stepanovicii]GGI42973.1 hypothetical protein GCM10010896_21090 [Mammaliicoccus stepanovicii]SNV51697.1 Uncharacterised protein [Mammaliicoccus stepanovicii]